LGLSLEAENKIDLAIAAYRRAIELDSAATIRSERPYLNLGILLTKSNRSGEALPILATAAEINPKSEKVRYQLGKAYFDLGRFAEAVPHLKSAVELNASDVPSHYLLAQAYRHLGQQDLAKEQFKQAETLLRASKANTPVGTMGAEQE
jgi:tetratricopeptide (TPR) repeat protein